MTENATLPNPYVGPRAIEKGQPFLGRDREIRSLYSLLVAERIVLLHSPSGAGKTSLIQAGLFERLDNLFMVLRIIRVNLEIPDEARNVASLNRYVLSTLLSLEEGFPPENRLPAKKLFEISIDDYLSTRFPEVENESNGEAKPNNLLLIFDQFEEILTVSLTDGAAKQVFFEQLGNALQNRRRWALFAIREDHLGGLAPFTRTIPNRFSVTYRLELLGPDAARSAIQQPAKISGVDFTDDAASKLVDDLRKVQVQLPDGSYVLEDGPYVEPVQLQVVCFNIWQSGAAEDKVIDERDLQRVGNVDQALASYYANAVNKVADQSDVEERIVRQWIDKNLITQERVRNQVLKGAETTEGLANSVVSLVENTHLVRGETRAGKTWYELSHDRLVNPVRDDNAAWFEKNLSLLQRQAVLWNQRGRRPGLLLRGEELEKAKQDAHENLPTPDEQEFLNACLAQHKQEQKEQRQKQTIQVSFLISLVALIFAGFSLFQLQIEKKKVEEVSTSSIKNAFSLVTQISMSTQAFLTASAGSTEAVSAIKNAQVAATETLRAFNATQGSVTQTSSTQGPDLAATSQVNLENSLNQAQNDTLAQALAANSDVQRLQGNPTLSTLLAIEAFRLSNSYQTKRSILNVVGNSILINSKTNHSDSGQNLNTLAFSPNGTHLAGGYLDGTIVLWNVNQLDYFSILGWGSTPPVAGLAFSPDGKVIYKGEYGTKALSIWDAQTPDRVAEAIQKKVTNHSDDILCLAISPDGNILATGSQDETIRLWKTDSLDQIGEALQPGAGWVQALAFSPDGKLLASGSRSSAIQLWSVQTGMPVGRSLSGHQGIILDLAFSPDGKTLASASSDKTVILWDLDQQKMIGQPLIGHVGVVNSLAFSPDGKTLVSGSNDGSLILWDTASQQRIGQIFTDSLNPINNVAFDPSGTILASGDKYGTISLWDMDGQAWLKIACGKAGGNLTLAQWSQYFSNTPYHATCPQFQ